MNRRNARLETGLALIVVMGLLTLLAVFGTSWARMAFFLRDRVNTDLDHVQARLLARSGLAYASARLFQESLAPVPPAAGNQSEDWTCRGEVGTPLEQAVNPSYAQTEPYVDLNGNGRYDVGIDPSTDLNANGRFDSWSGRLRDRHGLTGGTFALKILGESGKINLNGGWLDSEDRPGGFRFGSKIVSPCFLPNGVPDHRDRDEVRNRRYALLLDTLGAIVGVAGTKSPANPTGALKLGDLLGGKDLPGGRPYKGFKSMAEVRQRLFLLDEKNGEKNWRKVKDLLTVTEIERGTYSVWDRTGMAADPNFMKAPSFFEYPGSLSAICLGSESRPLVNLPLARREVLQALVQDLRLLYGADAYPISADLASRTADFLIGNRPFHGWYDLYVKLYRENPSIDPVSVVKSEERARMNGKVTGNVYWGVGPVYSWANVVYGNLLADEAEECTEIWGLPGGPELSIACCSPPLSWHTYDTPHATVPNSPRFRQVGKWGPLDWSDPNPSTVPAGIPVITRTGYYGGTLETSLVPREVSAFSIDCLGKIRSATGSLEGSSEASALLRVGAIVSARTQREFENAPDPVHSPYCRVIGRPFKDRMQTEPQFSLESMEDYATDPATGKYLAKARYSPFWGTIRLADRSGYRQGERFYVPAWDLDQPLRQASGRCAFETNFQDASDDFPSSFRFEWVSPVPIYSNSFAPPSSSDYAFTREVVFRGERPSSFNCAAAPGVAAPGTYTWPAGQFPMDDGHGNVLHGSVELWSTGRPGGLFGRALWLDWINDVFSQQYGTWQSGGNNNLLGIFSTSSGDPGKTDYQLYPSSICVNQHSSRQIMVGEWHHLVVALDSNAGISLEGYLDGIADPFLAGNDWEGSAINTVKTSYWTLGRRTDPNASSKDRGGYLGAEVDELRLYDKALDQSEAAARSLSSRYWTEERFPQASWPQEISERLKAAPSFTSPFYLFDRPVVPEGAQWNGFVPQLIREAVDGQRDVNGGQVEVALYDPTRPKSGSGSSGFPPIKVELLCYPGSDPLGPFRAVPLPESLWRTGGGWAEFKEAWRQAHGNEPIPRFRGFRYRVWMDCSAIDGFNPETPVFDSISMAFATPGRWLDFTMQ